jgi:hypothetical protein
MRRLTEQVAALTAAKDEEVAEKRRANLAKARDAKAAKAAEQEAA